MPDTELPVVRVHGYKANAGQRKPGATIVIDSEIPDDLPGPGEYRKDWQDRLAEKFGGDAQIVFDALSKNLPGGTLDQLLILMLKRKLSLYVVLDEPDTTIKDIAMAARNFVWDSEQWEQYQDSKTSNSVAWVPEWLLLCQAVEKRFGAPPVDPE